SDLAPDDPRRALLEKVEKQTFRASRIVSSLLDFARRPGVERQPVDLRPLIEETIELVRERLATHSVTLDWAAPTTDPRVLGSAGELQQVVTNLILNAIDALAPGGRGRIWVRLDAEAERVQIVVEDDGPGVPESLRAAIFEPFFTTRRGAGGTGLGLSISRGIVDQHGGRLTVDERPGGGARFTVDLPTQAGAVDA